MKESSLRAAAAAFVVLATSAIVGGASQGSRALADSDMTPDHARGTVFDGLQPGGGACEGVFEIDALGPPLCTHGPDVAPEGIDVREQRSAAQLRLATLSLPTVSQAAARVGAPETAGATASEAAAAEGGILPVVGDGTSGARFQAIYAVAADKPDRYAEVAPLIANWAAHVDTMMNESAALTGGERHLRYVTKPDGTLSVERVVLDVEGDDTFGNLIVALQSMGYTQPNRKYVIWTDANIYCGISTLYSDDKPTADNNNNGRFATYARIDNGCWGRDRSVELHEMVHSMGGVQKTAPHSTPGLHCSDDYDRMCYRDAVEVTMTYNCESWMEAYLDCGHDDYFHTSPPAGSYLSTHWNVANSSFLHHGPVDGSAPPPPPPPINEAPIVSVFAPPSATLGTEAVLDGSIVDDGLPGPYSVQWSQAFGPGAVTFANDRSEDTTVSFPVAGVFGLRLVASDGEFSSSAVVSIDVTAPAPVNRAPVVSVSGPSSIVLGTSAVLDGSVTDDGLPGPYSVTWTQAAGPGVATFANPTAEDTSVAFSAAGTYGVRLVANDGEMASSAVLWIFVEAAPTPANLAPTVSVWGPSSVVLGAGAALDGSVADDGVPGPYSVQWSQSSGPGVTSFVDAGSEDTSVSFSVAGTYVLTLTASDGQLTSSSSVTVVVTEPAEPVPTVLQLSGSLNKKWNTRAFEISVAEGQTTSALTFTTSGGSGGTGKGRKTPSANEVSLTLTVIGVDGRSVGTISGTDTLTLDLALPAGTYSWVVSGSSVNFDLVVTHF